jgi:hypothetical protein
MKARNMSVNVAVTKKISWPLKVTKWLWFFLLGVQ